MRSRNSKRVTDVELNITTFMNLMVVLIPFLLLDAVFTQMAVLQLSLPASEQQSSPPEEQLKPFKLEVLIYKNRYELMDIQSGTVLQVIPNAADGSHDRNALHETLAKLKEKTRELGKDVRDISILCEKDTPYVLLIETMDTVRITDRMVNGVQIKSELFPEINIGTAPPDMSGGGA